MAHQHPEPDNRIPIEVAAVALAVDGLADADLKRSDPLRGLQLAAAVSGAAEAAAMQHATTLTSAMHDPVAVVDALAFRAAARPGSGAHASGPLWSIWTLRRLQAGVSRMLEDDTATELAAVSAMLDAAYSTLAAYAHRARGNTALSEQCRGEARADHESAGKILHGWHYS